MYTNPNFKTKKALKQALAGGEVITAWQPGPFGPDCPDGWHSFEGPHYPQPHRWYARCRVEKGKIVEIAK